MDGATFLLCAVLSCLFGQNISQSVTRCGLMLRNRGFCVSYPQECPAGSEEYRLFSNFFGCFRVNHRCCAGNVQVKVPAGTTPPQLMVCGTGNQLPSARILGGSSTAPCDWPFVVSISAGNTIENADSRILVVAGEYNIYTIDLDPVTHAQQEQVIRISDVYIHPDYNITSLDDVLLKIVDLNSNAVALIKLAEPITGRCSGIVCLPTSYEITNNCASYDQCVITGWGFSKGNSVKARKDKLLVGRVRISSTAACDFLTERWGLTSTRPKGTTCQSPRDRNVDSCLGDEGGAVMCSNGHSWVVRGILPFNICEEDRYYPYITNLAPFMNWILATMNQP